MRKAKQVNLWTKTMNFGQLTHLGRDDNWQGLSDDRFSDEQRIVERVKKFKEQKGRTCNGLSLKVIAVCFIICFVFFFGSIYHKYSSNHSLVFVEKNFVKLASLPVSLKIIFNLMMESLSQLQIPLLVQGNFLSLSNFEKLFCADFKLLLGENLFEEYTKKSYEKIGELSQDIAFPRMLSWYKEDFSRLYFAEVCQEYIEKVKGERCSDQLLRTSLKTLSISIIERSKKILTKLKVSGVARGTAIELMNSHEVLQLGKNLTFKTEILIIV